jgi:CHAT domain-containing protein
MSVDQYRRRVASLEGEIAKLREKQADEQGKAARALDEAVRTEDSISKRTSASTMTSKLRQAQSKRKKAADHQKKAGRIGGDIARKLSNLESAQRNLDRALEQGRKKDESAAKKREAAEKKRRQEEARHLRDMQQQTRRLEREAEAARRAELAHERALTDELSRRTRFAASVSVAELKRLPKKVKIMFASAGPRDQQRLDLAEEARDVQQRLRASEHRDVVELKHVPALRSADLIPALNEHKPRVVHFAGHGSSGDELIFQDPDGKAKPVSLDALAATIATVSDHVGLVVLNACHTSVQANALTDHIPSAIGMSRAIGDEAARAFAVALYGAIADGFSVQRAFDQGLAQLKLDGLPDDQVPQLFAATGVEPDELVLVRPPGDALVDQVAA